MPRLEDMDRKLSDVAAKIDSASKTLEAPAPKDIATFDYAALTGDPPVPLFAPTVIRASSRMCRQGDFATDGFRYWMLQMKQPLRMHRKLWEWFFIADALFQRGQLEPGRTGLGFGVGLEPLTPLFASRGCRLTATDMAENEASSAGWTGQHAAGIDALNTLLICEAERFRQNVNFRVVDMNDIPADLHGRFDFCWSSCALEHLGSLEHGIRFVERSMDILKPGGIGVHTTEFNMKSNTDTFEAPPLSLYRRRDLDALAARLQTAGHRLEPIDWDQGHGYADGHVDVPPYQFVLHLRLRIAEYDCTSIGFIVHKGTETGAIEV